MRISTIALAFASAIAVLAAAGLLGHVPAAADVVSPCADGVADISGTLQVCTMIRENEVNRVLTEPLQAVAFIQDPFTGPTAHVSDTVGGTAFIFDLNANRPWSASIQTWNLPPGMELESDLVIPDVWVGDAVTFEFVCTSPPCNRPAPTRTPSPTAGLPPTREPSTTPTATLTAEPTVTPTVTASVTPSVTPSVTHTVTPSVTHSPTPSSTPSATSSTAPTAAATTTASSTATDVSAETPAATATASSTAPPPTQVPPTDAPPTDAPPTDAPVTPTDPAATPTSGTEGAKRSYLPVAFR